MEDSLLYSLLANELEIAGLRAVQGHSQDQPLASLPYRCKRLHTSDGARTAHASSAASMPDRARTSSFSGSYGQSDAIYVPSVGNSVLWHEQGPVVPEVAAPLASSAPADTSAISKLKMLLASNSTVRETALKLLQRTQPQPQLRQLPVEGQQQQQQLQQGAQLPSTWQGDPSFTAHQAPQLAMQQSLAGAPCTRGVSTPQQTSPRRSPHRLTSQHSSTLMPNVAADRPGTCTGQTGLPVQPPQTPSSAGAGFTAEDPATADWAMELEEQLLQCLKVDPAKQAVGATFSTGSGSNSGSFTQCTLPPAQLQQLQQLQQRQVRQWHAPAAQPKMQQRQLQHLQEQQAWATAPLPRINAAAIAPAGINHFQHNGMRLIDLPLSTPGDCSPDPASSSSSNNSNSQCGALAASGYQQQQGYGCAQQGTRVLSHSQPLPMLSAQELCWGHVSPGVKRSNSIDADQLLLNLLEEMAPAARH